MRYESIRVKVTFLQFELCVASFKVASPIPLYPVTKDEILSACGRANRICLNESESLQCTMEACLREHRVANGLLPKPPFCQTHALPFILRSTFAYEGEPNSLSRALYSSLFMKMQTATPWVSPQVSNPSRYVNGETSVNECPRS